ncbi:hypothetical protein COLO4_35843 [Corchorus olitorius]|uniref:Uncharacterized protein n=1 Tax=Corchorus olitorius TaxID=93759 RepID=A0A1R3GCR3_9ROSI|nr:hypothetical protein COLO4_35843 [Corchorus olitorius]
MSNNSTLLFRLTPLRLSVIPQQAPSLPYAEYLFVLRLNEPGSSPYKVDGRVTLPRLLNSLTAPYHSQGKGIVSPREWMVLERKESSGGIEIEVYAELRKGKLVGRFTHVEGAFGLDVIGQQSLAEPLRSIDNLDRRFYSRKRGKMTEKLIKQYQSQASSLDTLLLVEPRSPIALISHACWMRGGLARKLALTHIIIESYNKDIIKVGKGRSALSTEERQPLKHHSIGGVRPTTRESYASGFLRLNLESQLESLDLRKVRPIRDQLPMERESRLLGEDEEDNYKTKPIGFPVVSTTLSYDPADLM